jgi:hypothetical protein
MSETPSVFHPDEKSASAFGSAGRGYRNAEWCASTVGSHPVKPGASNFIQKIYPFSRLVSMYW